MKKLCILLLFLLSGFCLSGQTNENWYVGEWTCVVEGNSVFITKDKRLIAPDYYRGSRKMYEADEIGTTTFYRVPWDDDTPEEELTEENTISVGLDRADLILTLSTEEASMDYYLERNSSNYDSREVLSSPRAQNSDQIWREAFNEDGYMILTWKEGNYRSDIVLKGYGSSFKNGKVTIFGGGGRVAEAVGLYHFDDGVLMFPELMNGSGYPAETFAIEGRIFNVEFTPTISITEYKEPFQGKTEKRKYTQTPTYKMDFDYTMSRNPHPRTRN